MRFNNLPIGATFDFIDEAKPGYNSFFDRCEKVGARKYKSLKSGFVFTIGTVKCPIFHPDMPRNV